VLVAGAGDARAHPRVVVGLLPGYDSRGSGLREGDLLLRAGTRDLAGASAWRTYAQLYAAAGPDGAVAVTRARGGERAESREQLAAERHVWAYAALSLTFAATALLLVRRAPHSASARSFAVASLAWAAAQVEFQGAAPWQTFAYFGVRAALGFVWAPLMILAALHFPENAWPEHRRLPRWPWLFSVLGVTWIACWTGVPLPHAVALRANPVIGALAIAAILVVMTRNYRHADPAGRRQVRWVFLGSYLALAPSLAGTVVGAVRPDLADWWFLSQLALFAIPVSIYIAVTRSNLLDVDRLISSTAAYTLLLVGIGALALTVLPWLAREASARAGVNATVAQLGLAAVVAFLTVRLEPLLRPHVERAFFRERRALQDGIGRLVGELQAASDGAELPRLLGERLDDLLRPEFSVIYARSAEAFAPVFSRRCTITPHFELEGAFARELAARAVAIDLERDHGFAEPLGAAERAALRGLGAAALLPVVRGRDLLGFVALGRKSSGDVYTATDLALLGAVSHSVAASLARFDDAELLAGARALQERLRQYVPASIANRLVEGRGLEAGEREVSVLFADLRGYASFAEGRHAEEIFRVVSHYTETVTRVVTEHGGTVVEFNGDGMMAVFGAPDPLPDKERRALAAARRIVAEVGALRSPALGVAGGRLAVGVGLATGSAYVGAIRSVDRHIWSAIGNTTNLAARLQALTRELGAPIVIDRETRDAALEEAADFEPRAATRIRGLRASHDIYVLAA
jgi:class 3 adenylate cyclase